MIRVQTEDFDLNAQVAALSNPDQQSGAVVAFVGLVRDFTGGNDPAATMTLEHYPGMTENQLADIEQDARPDGSCTTSPSFIGWERCRRGSKLFWFWPVRATGKTPLMRPISSWIF